ncbi:MAG: LysR family transcriptional regulator [Akkermansia sp.]
MNIQHLRYFKKTIEVGQITEASKALYITQPALTNAIKSLEKEMGCALFAKHGNHLVATESGKAFYRYTSCALDNLDEGIEAAKQASMVSQDSIRVGREHQVRGEYFQALINLSLQSSSPDIAVTTITAARQELLDMLVNNEIDMIVVLAEVHDSTIDCKCMGRYDLVAIVNKNNPLAHLDVVTPSQLAPFKLATYHPSAPLTGKTIETLRENNLFPDQEYDDDNTLYAAASSNAAIVSLARYTSNVSLYPQIKTLGIQGIDTNLFGTYLCAKRSPHRSDAINKFIQGAFLLSLPAIETFPYQPNA